MLPEGRSNVTGLHVGRDFSAANVIINAVLRPGAQDDGNEGLPPTAKNSATFEIPRGEIRFRSIESPTSNFAGRDYILKTLKIMFDSRLNETNFENRTIVLTGMGGIGKSELARKFASLYKSDYPNVAWIDAENKNSLESSFMELADLPEFKGYSLDTTNAQRLARDLYRLLGRTETRSLFIFDNVVQLKTTDNAFGVRDYLPTEALDHLPLLLFTSRTTTWGGAIEIYPVKELADAEATQFFNKSFKIDSYTGDSKEELRASVAKLVRSIQGYPLAMTLAASYITEYIGSDPSPYALLRAINKFVKSLESGFGNVVKAHLGPEMPSRYEQTLSTIFRHSLRLVRKDKELGVQAEKTLQVMAFSDPAETPLDYVVDVCHPFGAPTGPTDQPYKNFVNAAQLLSRFQLVKQKGEPWFESLSMHRLIQRTTRIETNVSQALLNVLLYWIETEQDAFNFLPHLLELTDSGTFPISKLWLYELLDSYLPQLPWSLPPKITRMIHRVSRGRLHKISKWAKDRMEDLAVTLQFLFDQEETDGCAVAVLYIACTMLEFPDTDSRREEAARLVDYFSKQGIRSEAFVDMWTIANALAGQLEGYGYITRLRIIQMLEIHAKYEEESLTCSDHIRVLMRHAALLGLAVMCNQEENDVPIWITQCRDILHYVTSQVKKLLFSFVKPPHEPISNGPDEPLFTLPLWVWRVRRFFVLASCMLEAETEGDFTVKDLASLTASLYPLIPLDDRLDSWEHLYESVRSCAVIRDGMECEYLDALYGSFFPWMWTELDSRRCSVLKPTTTEDEDPLRTYLTHLIFFLRFLFWTCSILNSEPKEPLAWMNAKEMQEKLLEHTEVLLSLECNSVEESKLQSPRTYDSYEELRQCGLYYMTFLWFAVIGLGEEYAERHQTALNLLADQLTEISSEHYKPCISTTYDKDDLPSQDLIPVRCIHAFIKRLSSLALSLSNQEQVRRYAENCLSPRAETSVRPTSQAQGSSHHTAKWREPEWTDGLGLRIRVVRRLHNRGAYGRHRR